MNQLGAVEKRRRNLRIVLFAIILGTLPVYCLGFLLWGTAPARGLHTPTPLPATNFATILPTATNILFPSLTPFQFPTQNVPSQQPYVPPPVFPTATFFFFPTATFNVFPTATNFIFPTASNAPTLTLFPTQTPIPTDTPLPTDTPIPVPSVAPPTDTPIPANTDTQTPTPTDTASFDTPIPFETP